MFRNKNYNLRRGGATSIYGKFRFLEQILKLSIGHTRNKFDYLED